MVDVTSTSNGVNIVPDLARIQEPPPRRIVVAEDDADTRALLTHQLARAGYQVAAFENGKTALSALPETDARIVVADWAMPDMNGVELCRAVRTLSQSSNLNFVYFLMLTAHRDKEHIVAGLEAGADDYLTKPYHAEELLARIRAGERILDLQDQLIRRQEQLHRANQQMNALNSRLEQIANTDVLTGLANRRHLFERLEQTWSHAKRYRREMSLMLIDVDHFKNFNDSHGHAIGDLALEKLAELFQSMVRRHDVVARFGGEEFCVLCPETGAAAAGVLAERIRARAAETVIRTDEGDLRTTISVGVAGRRLQHERADDLVADADHLLYRAKRAGRNRVWVCDSQGRDFPQPALTPDAAAG